MRKAEVGRILTLESAINGLGAGACGCWGGTAKYAEYPKAKAKSRLGLSPSPSPSDGEGGRRQGKSRLGGSLALPVGRRSGAPVGANHYPFKFLTVRNLLSPTAASTYAYVSVNSLQCGNRGHGSACRHSMERVAMPTGRQAVRRESHGAASPPAPLHQMERAGVWLLLDKVTRGLFFCCVYLVI